MKDQNKPRKMIRGILFSFMIAVTAIIVESVLPVAFIGSTVIAIFIGVFINYFFPVNQTSLNEGVTFTAKRVLKLAIILLGGSLNISTIVEVGHMAIVILAFTLSTAFILGFFIGKIIIKKAFTKTPLLCFESENIWSVQIKTVGKVHTYGISNSGTGNCSFKPWCLCNDIIGFITSERVAIEPHSFCIKWKYFCKEIDCFIDTL